MPIKTSYKFFESLELSERDQFIGHEVLKEIKERLKFLKDVGLDYITLERSSGSLSGGEAQRNAWQHRLALDWLVFSTFWTAQYRTRINVITTTHRNP
jgi:excinuclease UvrABC ATPase subunit